MMPDVFTFRRMLCKSLEPDVLTARLAAAKTWIEYQALLKLIELGIEGERIRGNVKDSRSLEGHRELLRLVISLKFPALSSALHTIG